MFSVASSAAKSVNSLRCSAFFIRRNCVAESWVLIYIWKNDTKWSRQLLDRDCQCPVSARFLAIEFEMNTNLSKQTVSELATLMLGVSEWVQGKGPRWCCHLLATNTAFTTKVAAWSPAQANGDALVTLQRQHKVSCETEPVRIWRISNSNGTTRQKSEPSTEIYPDNYRNV